MRTEAIDQPTVLRRNVMHAVNGIKIRRSWWMPIILLVSFWLAISIGAAKSDLLLPWHALQQGFGLTSPDSQIMTIVNHIRLPRAILAVLVGFALAISGASLQGISRNPLADPGLLGISSGAAAAAVSGIVFMKFLTIPAVFQGYFLPVLAFLGAAFTAFIINMMSQINGRIQVATLLLAGVALNALFAAEIGLMSYLADDQSLRLITYWLMGSLSAAAWHNLTYIAPLIIIAVLGILKNKQALNLMLLGEANATYMGVSVEKVKRELMWFNALAVGVAVSVSGIIGFIGLVIPHLVRISLGSDYRRLLPQSLWLGGAFMLLADTVSRMIAIPAEVPIGIITSLIGAPVFIILLIQQKKRLQFGA